MTYFIEGEGALVNEAGEEQPLIARDLPLSTRMKSVDTTTMVM